MMIDVNIICMLTCHMNSFQDYRSVWPKWSKTLQSYDDFNHFVELFGVRRAKEIFISRVRQLRQEYITKRKADYLRCIPGLLEEFFPTLQSIAGRLVIVLLFQSWENQPVHLRREE